MIMTTYHDFRSLWWAIRPVCPTKSRDITSSGWARTGSGGGRRGFGSGRSRPGRWLGRRQRSSGRSRAGAPRSRGRASGQALIHLIRPGNPMIGHGFPRTSQAQSTNWSGYAATGSFTSVSASWTEPAGHCTSATRYSSFWVGLDGYNGNTVEQTGSEVDCSGGSPVYYSWYEMYPAFPVNFSNTVRPGDHFNGSVTFNGGSSYTLVLSNTTQGWSHTAHKPPSGAATSSA